MSFLDSEEWPKLNKLQQEVRETIDKQYDEYWNSLSYDDKLKSFYSVVKRIYQAEIIEKRSYRGALYDVFEFGPDAYIVGMECGYMSLHNAIVESE